MMNSIQTYERPLYKHMRAAHAAALVSMGVLRVGTLADFRRSETYGQQIGDDEEGIRIDEYPADVCFTSDTQPEWSRNAFKLAPGASLRIQSYGIRHGISSENQWVLSFSKRQESSIGKAICAEYDACVAIHDSASFLRGVTAALGHANMYGGIFACTYQKRSQDGDSRLKAHPALLKDLRYQYQEEVRAIWTMEPRGSSEPRVVANVDLVKFCHRLF